MKNFNINDFCYENLFFSQHAYSTPWKKGEEVYATDGAIIFIGQARDFPEIQPVEIHTHNVKALGIDKISGYEPINIKDIEIILEPQNLNDKLKFKGTLVARKYLDLIKDSMQKLGGEWQVSVREPLELIVFKNERVTIGVMPMR